MIVVAGILLLLAFVPAALTLQNLKLFQLASEETPPSPDKNFVSIVIPVRNEEAGLESTLSLLIGIEDLHWEAIVVDDHSEDHTSQILAAWNKKESRIRFVMAPELPRGWNGKQHACWVGAQHTIHPWVLFIDADVHLEPQAILRSLTEIQRRQVELLSGFPRQVTKTIAEKAMVPMMYHLLLGFLPFDRMRKSASPAFSAGCGQWMLVRREIYMKIGGHAQIKDSRHDGILLPRVFRRCGYPTDLFDASNIASCRMYRGWKEVLQGLQKNADEGIANRKRILPFTLLIGGGWILPLPWLIGRIAMSAPFAECTILAVAATLSLVSRWRIASRWQQPFWTVVFGPVISTIFLAIQWWCFLRGQRNRVLWKGRLS